MNIKMSKLILYTILVTMSFSSFGQTDEQTQNQDVSLNDINLSLKYQRGSHLLFDCFSGHWVCTDEFRAKDCDTIRRVEILDNIRDLNCANVKKFESEKKCIKEQRFLVSNGVEHRFCLNDIYKKNPADEI